MMEDLKRQKLQQQMQARVTDTRNHPVQVNSLQSISQRSFGTVQMQGSPVKVSIEVQMTHKQNNQSPIQAYQPSYKGSQIESKDSSPYFKQNSQIGNNEMNESYEDVKKKKLEELKVEIINEQSILDEYNRANNQYQISFSNSNINTQQTYYQTSDNTNFQESFSPQSNSQKQNNISTQPKTVENNVSQKTLKGQQTSQQSSNRQIPKYNPLLEAKESQSSTPKITQRLQPRYQESQKPPTAKPQTRNQKDVSQTRQNTHQQNYQTITQSLKTIDRKKSSTPMSHQSEATTPKANLSEKTQQIYFQKLQKEVEIAIRNSDTQEKGCLDIEEFKECFYQLKYLPYMQQSIQIENQRNNRGMDYALQSTTRNLIIQEKEFIYNLWSVLNPTNNDSIDNALLYDVLLLLIYNVKSTIPVTAGFLSEYLENFYLEENIDLQSFANYNSGSSLGMRSSNEPDDTNVSASNLNKYLAYNNQWSVEKICIEFKQIHANKVSYTQTSRQRSPSPMASQTHHYISNLKPDDNRKYKKNVVEQHMSQLTFSPNINDKTKVLDNQLTQKLLGQKRDVSADNIARNQMLQETDQNALSNLQRYELLFYRHHLAEQKIEKAKENLLNKELKECSFKPKLQTQANVYTRSYQNLQKSANQIFQDLSQKIKQNKEKFEESNKIDKEMQECTFKPNIQKNAKKPPKADGQVPKGYYEQINRIRKQNEEKRALEEKLQKKAKGDNYEKLKQMNIKPPSFLDKERQKKKLLLYVDVNITPTKTGRIGIYEGDKVRDLAKNFQKAFQLNANMLNMLVLQLEAHLQSYKEKQGIINDDKTAFPMSNDHHQPNFNQRLNSLENQVQEENSDDEDQVEERNFRNQTPMYGQQENELTYQDEDGEIDEDGIQNDTQKLNEYIRREIERFEQLGREEEELKQMQQQQQYYEQEEIFQNQQTYQRNLNM